MSLTGTSGVTNLLGILAACGGREPGAFASYAALKREVTDAVEAILAPIRACYAKLATDPGQVREILAEGHGRVRPAAQATVRRARAAIGLLD